jgi:hypothetical protein
VLFSTDKNITSQKVTLRYSNGMGCLWCNCRVCECARILCGVWYMLAGDGCAGASEWLCS